MQDKNIQIVNIIGLSILFISLFFGDRLFGEYLANIFETLGIGFIFCIWIYRFLTKRDDALKAKNKSKQAIKKLEKEYKLK